LHDSPAKVREYGEHIDAESRRLSRLIDNVLDFSRIESGRKSYHFVPTRVEDVVEATIGLFRTRLGSSFEIHYEAPAGSIPPLILDRDAVGQALSNLLDNAVKYSGDSRRIAVSVRDEGSEIVCAVQDHGVGIARAEQKRIFERFHRVSTGLIHDVKGSGLGLSIVQHIVAAHHGRATVESEPGRGTTFRLHFPKGAPASAPEPASERERQKSSGAEAA
jgi:signal transduction histidine kinase